MIVFYCVKNRKPIFGIYLVARSKCYTNVNLIMSMLNKESKEIKLNKVIILKLNKESKEV